MLQPCCLLRLAQRGPLRRSHRRLGLACCVLRALLRALLLALEHLRAQSGLDLRPGRVELEAEDTVAVVTQLLCVVLIRMVADLHMAVRALVLGGHAPK